jgi:hypothetical protein
LGQRYKLHALEGEVVGDVLAAVPLNQVGRACLEEVVVAVGRSVLEVKVEGAVLSIEAGAREVIVLIRLVRAIFVVVAFDIEFLNGGVSEEGVVRFDVEWQADSDLIAVLIKCAALDGHVV